MRHRQSPSASRQRQNQYKLPPLGLIAGVATVGKLTVKLNVVVLVTPPPVAVTVMLELPAGVELLVLMVSVEEQAGLQLVEEKEAVAPVGKPEAEKGNGLSASRCQGGADRVGHRRSGNDRYISGVGYRKTKRLGDGKRGAGFRTCVVSALERLGFHGGAARKSHRSGVETLRTVVGVEPLVV